MSRPVSEESTIDIAEIEKSFPTPPRLSVSIRKTLPPLPPVIESPRASPSPSPSSSPSTVSSPRRGSATKLLFPSQGAPIRELSRPLDIRLNFVPPPPIPVSNDQYRPLTASTKTLSFISSQGTRRTIKYGTGKFSGVELSPQPSDDPDDPLNWPMWKKHLNFAALILMVALVGVMKTAFVSAHGAVAMGYNVSYTAAVALTAVPLIISAFIGVLSSVAARIWGKRPVYLVSTFSIFLGVILNANFLGSFSQHMAGRVFQGLGWGAFETLVLSSIQDTYFEHQRHSKITIYHIVATATTWGSPLLGGVVSSRPGGFTTQFKVISSFLSISIILLAFGGPETVFDRPNFLPLVPVSARSRTEMVWPQVKFTKAATRSYLGGMKPWSYKTAAITSRLVLQAPRALVAPTTLLLFVVTLLPHITLWSLASSLALLFSPMPFMLQESALGALMTGPFLLATAAAAALALPYYLRRFTTIVHVATIAAGTAVASIGIFGLGLYIRGVLQMPSPPPAAGGDGMPWSIGFVGDRLSFPVVSLLLGLLSAGSLVLDAAARPAVQRSTAFTSSSLLVGLRNTADMHGGLACLRSLAAGVAVLSFPAGVTAAAAYPPWDGLRSATVGLGVAQVLVAAAVCAVWWYRDEDVRRLDGRAMGLVDLSILKRQGSFFDTD